MRPGDESVKNKGKRAHTVTNGVICVSQKDQGLLTDLIYCGSKLVEYNDVPGVYAKGPWTGIDLFESDKDAVVIFNNAEGNLVEPAKDFCQELERNKVRFSANVRYTDKSGEKIVYSHEACLD